ncbi:MAG: hypothetical protein ACI9C1_000939 [Candidatus Aldehydirespiratoraceae bacterium]
MTTVDAISTRPSVAQSRPNRWEGQLFGGLVLAAFVLYGVGSALGNESIGLALVVANSVAVTVVGIIGFRVLRNQDSKIAAAYLAARVTEAVLLAGGIALHTIADVSGADNTGYLLAMSALGVGSVPFWRAIGRGPGLPNGFALWGVAGYVALTAGAALELATGRGVAAAFSIPGGLFEIAVGIYLLRRGFWNERRNA